MRAWCCRDSSREPLRWTSVSSRQTTSTRAAKVRARQAEASLERTEAKASKPRIVMPLRTGITPRRSSRVPAFKARSVDTNEQNAQRYLHTGQREMGQSPGDQGCRVLNATSWCFVACTAGGPARQEGTLLVDSTADDHICHASFAVGLPRKSNGTVLHGVQGRVVSHLGTMLT